MPQNGRSGMKPPILATNHRSAPPGRGRALATHEEMLMFHAGRGPAPETLQRLRENLDRAGIEHVVIGAFALGAHGFARATNDVDVCVRAADLKRFREQLAGGVYEPVEGRTRRFRDPATDATIDFLISGELAGRTNRNSAVRFPDPSEAIDIGGLRTVSLPRLIELKLVTWRFKDWGDVVELIRANKLDEAFAEKLDPLVRMAYLECYDQKREEDRHAREA